MPRGDLKLKFSLALSTESEEPATAQAGVRQPSQPGLWPPPAVFLRPQWRLPRTRRHISRRAERLSLFCIGQCQHQRSKISPEGCLIAIGEKKIMLFQGRKGEFSIPPVSSETLYLLIRSHSNLNKHIHHSKKCHLSDCLASSVPKHN